MADYDETGFVQYKSNKLDIMVDLLAQWHFGTCWITTAIPGFNVAKIGEILTGPVLYPLDIAVVSLPSASVC